MPSISRDPSRHGIVDRRDGQYLCFPDVCRTASGRLVVVYCEADRHAATRRRLLVRVSDDLGRTWADPAALIPKGGHCARIASLDDRLLVLVDGPGMLFESPDNGETWSGRSTERLDHQIPDRILALSQTSFLTAGHLHRGSAPHPACGQAPTEPMVYRSDNGGATWKAISLLAFGPHLTLCEASMTRLADGRILALARENSQVFEPMYAMVSEDLGRTWSDPLPTPLIGHRPCLGLTRDGRLLVTYRNVGPDHGTAAWLGSLEELLDPRLGGYAVHAITPSLAADNTGNPRLTEEGLRIDSPGGMEQCAIYCLRPLSDPASARAVLTARMRSLGGERYSCGVRLGVWWRISPDRIRPEIPGARSQKLDPGKVNELRFTYAPGLVTLHVNGRKKRSWPLAPGSVTNRPILFGQMSRDRDNAGASLWRSVELHISEPRFQREHHWLWRPELGLPDAYARERVLELRNDRRAIPPDFGYSGWTELDPGEFFCVHHHGGGEAPDYRPGFTSHVAWVRFSSADFPA